MPPRKVFPDLRVWTRIYWSWWLGGPRWGWTIKFVQRLVMFVHLLGNKQTGRGIQHHSYIRPAFKHKLPAQSLLCKGSYFCGNQERIDNLSPAVCGKRDTCSRSLTVKLRSRGIHFCSKNRGTCKPIQYSCEIRTLPNTNGSQYSLKGFKFHVLVTG